MAFRRNTIWVYVMAQWTIHSLPADDGEPDRAQWGLNRVSSLLYTVPVLVAGLNQLLIQSHPPTQYSIAAFKLECVYCDHDNLIVWPSTTSPDLIVICYFDLCFVCLVFCQTDLQIDQSNCETRQLIKYWSGLYYDTTCCCALLRSGCFCACTFKCEWLRLSTPALPATRPSHGEDALTLAVACANVYGGCNAMARRDAVIQPYQFDRIGSRRRGSWRSTDSVAAAVCFRMVCVSEYIT